LDPHPPLSSEPAFAWGPTRLPPLPPVTWRGARLNLVLFALTAASVLSVFGLREGLLPGGDTYLFMNWTEGLQGLAGTFAILLAHEFGHWFAARHHGVDASLPYFLPLPVFSLVGTLGAFIRIRSPFPSRRALFDIGIAGPLAGFIVCLPVLALGCYEGRFVPNPEGPGGLQFGEPLLFQWMLAALRGPTPEGMTVIIGPFGLAAWFGLFLTALNLMPVGQLDGGHVTHALFPRHAQWISRAGIVLCLFLLYRRPTWLVWALLLLAFGRRSHPPTLDDREPPGRARAVVGALALVTFVLCFTPDTIIITWEQVLGGDPPL